MVFTRVNPTRFLMTFRLRNMDQKKCLISSNQMNSTTVIMYKFILLLIMF